MFSFYMKKTFVDTMPGIELVNIHYTWTPLTQMPNWETHRETRAMPRGGTLVRGMGGTTIDETGEVRQTQQDVIGLPDDGIRRKIIKLPDEILNPDTGKYSDTYLFHHYFEIFRRWQARVEPTVQRRDCQQGSRIRQLPRRPRRHVHLLEHLRLGFAAISAHRGKQFHRKLRRGQSLSFLQVLWL